MLLKGRTRHLQSTLVASVWVDPDMQSPWPHAFREGLNALVDGG